MTQSALEQLLALGLVLVYLLDSLRLLGPREAAIEGLGPSRWAVRLGVVGFDLFGRRPLLPNPLRPDRPLWAAHWRLDGEVEDTAVDALPTAGRGLRTLGRVSLAELVLVVGVAPVMLWIGRSEGFLVAVLLAYLLAIGAAVGLVLAGPALGVSRWSAAGIGVIGMLCLPCAPNLLRAVTGRQALAVVLPAFAEAGGAGAVRFWRVFRRVLERERLLAGEESEAGQRVTALLAGEAPES